MYRKNKRLYKYLKKKTILFSMLILALNIFLSVQALANDIEMEIIEEQVESNEIKSINEKLKEYSDDDIKKVIPGYDPKSIIKDTTMGKLNFDFVGIINRILKMLCEEVFLNIDILLKLMVLIVLCAILKNIQASFMSKSVGELAFYICYIVLVSILLTSFNTTVRAAFEMIDGMVNIMYSAIPVLITLMVSSGNITSGGVLQPLLISIVQISATLIKNVFIPLIILSTIVSVVGNVSDKVQVSKLSAFLKHFTTWFLGIILTVFIAVVSLQGSLGAVIDGVTSKTAKFAIGVFIPVVGKYLADAADTVIGCTLLIKNAAGVAVMIGIIAMCLFPIIKMLAVIVLYRITCVLMEPLAEERIIKCISEVANSITFVVGIVAAVVFMFLITITALIMASNISAMVR